MWSVLSFPVLRDEIVSESEEMLKIANINMRLTKTSVIHHEKNCPSFSQDASIKQGFEHLLK